MSLYNRFLGWFGKATSGYEVQDRVETNQLPQTPRPQVASKELSPHTRQNILGQSRYYYRNDGTIKDLVNNLALYAVGSGITPQPMSSNTEFNNAALEMFKHWWKKPEITGRFTGRQIQEFISVCYDTDGEIFIVKTFDPITGEPRIQLVESQQVKSPDNSSDFESGIKFDEWGRPVAYSIEQANGTFKIVPANSVIHVFNAERASSTRGISTFFHLLSLTNQRTELLDLTIQKARQEAKFVNAIEQSKSDDALSAQDYLNGNCDAETEAEEEERMLYESAARVSSVIGGTTVSLPSGMTLKQLSNNTPGNTYLGFAEQLLKLSSTGLMPYGFSDPSNLTGVSVRMTIAKAGRVISARQDIICEVMSQIYQYFIGCLIGSGVLAVAEDTQNVFAVEWLTPKIISVDYGRDEKTDLALVQAGLKPIEDYYTERGLEFKQEVAKRLQALEEIKKQCEVLGVEPAAAFPALFTNKTI